MDAISMLKDDHKTVERLFKRFEAAGEHAFVEKREVVDRMIEELSAHAAIEEQLFYPVTRATVDGVEDIALESLEEHNIVKWVLSDLETMSPEHERFEAKVTVLIENVRHHVKEEEEEFFPMVRAELGRNALSDLGDAMAMAKNAAPTHPHPRSPDTPPGNLFIGTAAGVADRIGDTVSGLAQGSVTALGDIVATVLRRKKPSVSPTGSKVARNTARRARDDVAEVTESAIKVTQRAKKVTKRSATTARTTAKVAKSGAASTARAAKRAGTSTARVAKASVKGTRTSTRASTKRAVTTAKRGATSTTRTARKAAKSTATTAKRSAARSASTAKRSARTR